MRPTFRWPGLLAIVALLGVLSAPLRAAVPAVPATADPLPSWAEGATKQSIVDFVRGATTPGTDFIPPPERVAVFDNDGTLWPEQPIYTQFQFILDRVREMAPRFPGWRTQQPFKAAIENDLHTLAASGGEGLLRLVMATSAGMTTEAFETLVQQWIGTTRDPRFKRRYTELAYQPMIELLSYLRAAGFKTWIVSGGGSDFIRPWSEPVYGVPPEQVIGSSLKLKLESFEHGPALVRLPEIGFIDDRSNKPVAIHEHIGRRPVLAVGNSDGDLAMLEWTRSGPGKRMAMLVHHTDARREWAYDRGSKVGQLDHALDAARKKGWPIIDMRSDWKRIFAFER